MTFKSDAQSAYRTGDPVSKGDVHDLWQAVDDLQYGSGKIFQDRNEAVSHGQDKLPVDLRVLITIDGQSLEIRRPNQQDEDTLFNTYPFWGIAFTVDTARGFRDGGVLRLSDAAMDGNVIKGNLPIGLDKAGVSGLSSSSLLFFQAPEDRTTVTQIEILGDTSEIRHADGQAVTDDLPLVAGRGYILRRHGANQWRIVAGSVHASDINQIERDLRDNLAMITDGLTWDQMDPESGVRLWDGESGNPGETVADENWSTTEYIPVRKGDCFCLVLPEVTAGGNRNRVAFFENKDNPSNGVVGSLIYGMSKPIEDNRAYQAMRVSDEPMRHMRKYFRVERDGWIRIAAHRNDRKGIILRLIGLDEYKQHVNPGVSELMMDALDNLDVLYSPVFTDLGRGFESTESSSTPTQARRFAMTDYIPVSAGDRVHAMADVQGSGDPPATLAIYNSKKVLVELRSDFNAHLNRYFEGSGGFGRLVHQNYEAKQNGFVRLITAPDGRGRDDQQWLFVTSEWLDYEYPLFNEASATPRTERVRNFRRQGGYFQPFGDYDLLGPVFLRPGQIARIKTTAVPNTADAAMCWVDGPANVDNDAGGRAIPFMQLFPNAELPADYEGTRFVYATDHPHVLIVPTAHGTGSIEIIDQDTAIAERNDILSNGSVSARVFANGNWPLGRSGEANERSWGYIPVFPGEVLRINQPTVWTDGGSFVFRAGDESDEGGSHPEERADRYVNIPYAVHNAITTPSGGGSDPVNFIRAKKGRAIYYWGHVEPSADAALVFDDPPRIITEAEYKSLDNAAPGYFNNFRLWVSATSVPDGAAAVNPDTGAGIDDDQDGRWRMSMPIFLLEGECVEWKMNVGTLQWVRGPVAFWRDANNDLVGQYLVDGTYHRDLIPQPMMGYYRAERDCVIYLMERLVGSSEDPDTRNSRQYAEHYQRSIRYISEDEYQLNAEPQFEGRTLKIPDPNGLEIRVVNGVMPYNKDRIENTSIMQFWRNGTFLTSVRADNRIQGQATAELPKKNIDMKDMVNRDGKKIAVKIADWKATKKLTLKANFAERTQIRDSLAAEIWRDIRRAHPYPYDLIWDPSLMDQIGEWPDAAYMQDATCSTHGTPVSVTYGDKFYGLYTLRTKKDAPNYGIREKHFPHIWLQSDYRIFWPERNAIDWTSFSWKAWDVTKSDDPSGTYEPGQVHPNPDVRDAVERLFNWIADCVNGQEDFLATYRDYIDADSFIDYLMAAEMVNHWDGARNNVILTTYDAKKWWVHLYDLDHTWDRPKDERSYDAGNKANAGLWRLFYDNLRDRMERRWEHLRRGVISTATVQAKARAMANMIPDGQRLDDDHLWGANSDSSTVELIERIAERAGVVDHRMRLPLNLGVDVPLFHHFFYPANYGTEDGMVFISRNLGTAGSDYNLTQSDPDRRPEFGDGGLQWDKSGNRGGMKFDVPFEASGRHLFLAMDMSGNAGSFRLMQATTSNQSLIARALGDGMFEFDIANEAVAFEAFIDGWVLLELRFDGDATHAYLNGDLVASGDPVANLDFTFLGNHNTVNNQQPTTIGTLAAVDISGDRNEHDLGSEILRIRGAISNAYGVR